MLRLEHRFIVYLWGGDGLGVHSQFLSRSPTRRHGLHQDVNTHRLAGPTRAQGHHTVPHPLRLEQLDELEDPRFMVD